MGLYDIMIPYTPFYFKRLQRQLWGIREDTQKQKHFFLSILDYTTEFVFCQE